MRKLHVGPSPSKKAKVDDEADGGVVDFSKLKVAELREECKKRGLDSSGKKSDLVSRLEGAKSDSGGTFCT